MVEPTSNAGDGLIRRVAFGGIRDTLVAQSNARKTNADYNAIVILLGELDTQEAAAATRADFQAIVAKITNLEGRVAGAASRFNGRNTALTTMSQSLTVKKTEFQQKAAADAVTANPTTHAIGDGPKAGFEFEYPTVWVLNIDAGTPYIKRWFTNFSSDAVVPSLKKLRYTKREVLFSGPNGTWEGQADTSLKHCSNLEIVTKPLTAADWNTAEVTEDHVALAALIAALEQGAVHKLLLPKQLDARVQVHQAGMRIFKTGNGPGQTQMTAAVPIEKAKTKAPDWWVDGMNWNAFSYLHKTVRALETGTFEGKNPKTAFGNVITKTPIGKLLGTPAKKVDAQQVAEFVIGAADELRVNVKDQVAAPVVKHSIKKSKEDALNATGFTYGDYLAGFVKGRDMVTEWAEYAFGGDEDMGLGQIDDDTLPGTHVVEEHRRSLEKVHPKDFQAKGKAWAQSGKIPDAN